MNKEIPILEEILEAESIEEYIADLAHEVLYLDTLLVDKPWEK